MRKFDGVLLCTDLDGTLLRNDKTVSHENLEAIDYFKREGGSMTFITGRLPSYSVEAYELVRPNVPYGCINGGGLYDGEKNEYIFMQELSRRATGLIPDVLEQMPEMGVQICTARKSYFINDNAEMEKFRRRTRLPNLACDYRDVEGPITKIIFGTDREWEIPPLEQILRTHSLSEEFTLVRSERCLFDVMPRGVNKGQAVRWLVEYLRPNIRKTVAVGDYDNDVGMLEAADVGVAVSNASPRALAAADIVTVSNEEHALMRVIEDLERGRY